MRVEGLPELAIVLGLGLGNQRGGGGGHGCGSAGRRPAGRCPLRSLLSLWTEPWALALGFSEFGSLRPATLDEDGLLHETGGCMCPVEPSVLYEVR